MRTFKFLFYLYFIVSYSSIILTNMVGQVIGGEKEGLEADDRWQSPGGDIQ